MLKDLINKIKFKYRNTQDNHWIFGTMLVGSIASVIASLILSIDAVELAKNTQALLSCDLNSVLSCSTVNSHPTAFLFGFPNSFIGLMAEPVVITVAIAGLSGIKFPKLFMAFAQVGYTLGLIFAIILFMISYLIIGSLCPWCLLVTLTTILVWFSITRYNIRENNLFLPEKVQSYLFNIIRKDYDKLLMWSIIIMIVILILLKYGNGIFDF